MGAIKSKQQVHAKSTCTIYAEIEDSADQPLPAESIAILEATLYLKDSAETVLNDRETVDLCVSGSWPIVDGMKGTIPTTGRLEVFLSSADNEMSDATANSEIHVLMIHFVTTGALPQEKYEFVEFEVLNLKKVTITVT